MRLYLSKREASPIICRQTQNQKTDAEGWKNHNTDVQAICHDFSDSQQLLINKIRRKCSWNASFRLWEFTQMWWLFSETPCWSPRVEWFQCADGFTIEFKAFLSLWVSFLRSVPGGHSESREIHLYTGVFIRNTLWETQSLEWNLTWNLRNSSTGKTFAKKLPCYWSYIRRVVFCILISNL